MLSDRGAWSVALAPFSGKSANLMDHGIPVAPAETSAFWHVADVMLIASKV